MTLLLIALGSRGDVEPMTVLAKALLERGCPVRVVALAEYQELVEASGAEFVPVAGALTDALGSARLSRVIARTPLGQLALLKRWTAGLADSFADAVLAAVSPGDVVITGILGRGVAAALTEARRTLMATVTFTAQSPTLHRDSHYFGSMMTGWTPYDRFGVRLNWELSGDVGSALTTAVRRRLGLGRASRRHITQTADRYPVLIAASPVLIPPADDWPAQTTLTGWLAPPSDARLPRELESWLRAGPPPIYVGFGSFTGFAGAREFTLITEAAERPGARVVTPAVPDGPVGDLGPRLFATGPVPHAALFPRTAGVIHHGGAGTTHAGLRAGVGSVAVPFGVDQPYHARRLHQLGVGPAPVPIHRLNSAGLARLIAAFTGPDATRYAARAAPLGAQLRAEDGVRGAVDALAPLL